MVTVQQSFLAVTNFAMTIDYHWPAVILSVVNLNFKHFFGAYNINFQHICDSLERQYMKKYSVIYETKYSRMNQAKFLEDSL